MIQKDYTDYAVVKKCLRDWLDWQTDGLVITTLEKGEFSSETRTYAVVGPQKVIVKIGDVYSEYISQQRVAQVLPHRLPIMITSNYREFIVYEAISGNEFLTIASNEQADRSAKILRTVLSELKLLWLDKSPIQRESVYPNDIAIAKKLTSYCKNLTDSFSFEKRLVVNGKICHSFIETLNGLSCHYGHYPARLFPTHGDPWPGNIIVTDDDEYFLIDGRDGYYDWVDDFIKLAQWHKFHLLNSFVIDVQESSRAITISYRSDYLPIVAKLEQLAFEIGQNFAREIDDQTWLRRFYLLRCRDHIRDAARNQWGNRYPQRQKNHRWLDIALAIESYNQHLAH